MYRSKSGRSALLETCYSGYPIVQTDLPPYLSLREKNGKYKSEDCVNIRNSGHCIFAKNCHFRHPEDNQPERSNHREEDCDPNEHRDFVKALDKVTQQRTYQHSSMAVGRVGDLNGRSYRIKPDDPKTKHGVENSRCDQLEVNPRTNAMASRSRTESDRFARHTPSRHRYDDDFLIQRRGFDEQWN